MAGVLAVTSNPDRTSPVKRGKWILEQVLGQHTAPPPADAGNLKAIANADKLTIKERFRLHTDDPNCASCHRLMDPIGFGFENFDQLGRWRQKYTNNRAIDPSGQLPNGQKFNNFLGLQKILLSQQDAFIKHFTAQVLTYALGRGVQDFDRVTINRIAKKLAKNDYQAHILIKEIVKSYPFNFQQIAKPKKRNPLGL